MYVGMYACKEFCTKVGKTVQVRQHVVLDLLSASCVLQSLLQVDVGETKEKRDVDHASATSERH